MSETDRRLYAAWEGVRDRGGWALSDLRTGRDWTFGEIQDEVDALPAAEPGRVCFPTGFSVGLIFETLRAWRDGAVLCPIESASDPPPLVLFDGLPADTCLVKLTSGSTGAPRLVRFVGPDLAADARKIVTTMELRPGWPNLGVISMAHSYGFSSLVLPLLLHGIPLAWLGDPLPGAVGAALGKAPAAGEGWTLPAVPAMWRAWQSGGALSQALPRLAISAGAPLPILLERAIHESVGLKIHNFLGSSECGGIAYDRRDQPRESADLVGVAMDETELRVNADGCLEVRGPSVAAGYWPEEAGGALGDGVFLTGDLAEIDEAGNVRLAGRRDDLINVAGRKVNPAKIENALAALPGIGQVVVFGVPSSDAARGDEIVVLIRHAETTGLETLKRAAAPLLPSHERPRHWRSCPDLEPDRRGKLSRDLWRRRFLAGGMEQG